MSCTVNRLSIHSALAIEDNKKLNFEKDLPLCLFLKKNYQVHETKYYKPATEARGFTQPTAPVHQNGGFTKKLAYTQETH